MSEAEYLESQSDGGAEEYYREWESQQRDKQVFAMQGRYKLAKTAEVGATIPCPYCGKLIIKRTYHKIFCSNARTHGKNNCKDKYWNMVKPRGKYDPAKRRERITRFDPEYAGCWDED